MVLVKEDAVTRAHRLCREHAWQDACAEFAAAKSSSQLVAADLEAWAVASHITGQAETAALLWTDAHQAWLEGGEPGRAVRCAFWQGLTLAQRGEHARGGGWFARAGGLLEGFPAKAPEHAYLRLPGALQAMEAGEPELALRVCAEVTTVADAVPDHDLATLGRLGQGQSLVLLGEASRGTAMLDEVMLAVISDEVSPLLAGLAYCTVIITCQQALDLQRAQQWTSALSTWCSGQQGIKPYRGQCLVHRAELLQLRGKWDDAMSEIRAACEHLADTSGDPAQGMAYYQLGELLRLRGEFAEAENAYRKANQWGHSVQPGMALLRLAQGRIDDALAALARVVGEDQPPVKGVHALAAYVDVAVVAGETTTARDALGRLTKLTERFTSPYLGAICDHARGVVLLAGGDPAAAAPVLQAAKGAWLKLDAPAEAARSAMHLGAAYHKLGDLDSAALEWGAAREHFTEAGALTDLARLDQLSGASSGKLAGLTARETEILTHVAAGETNRQIADALVISEHTVRRHLQNIFAKLDLPSRAAATAWAYQHHLLATRRD